MATWKTYPDFAGGSDYYYNTATGVSTWTRPADLPPLDYDTDEPRLSAGSHASKQREGGGSKELEGGTPPPSDADDGVDAMFTPPLQMPVSVDAAKMCQGREQADKSEEPAEVPQLTAAAGPALVWVPVPQTKTAAAKPAAAKPAAAKSAAAKLAPNGFGGTVQQSAAKNTVQQPLLEQWQNPGDGMWHYHEYNQQSATGTTTNAVAKWVIRNAVDGNKGAYQNERGATVETTADLQPATLAGVSHTMADLTRLDSLEEPLIIFQLQQRFVDRQIYTDIGDILVSMNPYPLEAPKLSDEEKCVHWRMQHRTSACAHVHRCVHSLLLSHIVVSCTGPRPNKRTMRSDIKSEPERHAWATPTCTTPPIRCSPLREQKQAQRRRPLLFLASLGRARRSRPR